MIDRSHRPWAFTAGILLVGATGIYAWQAAKAPGEWRAGQPIGLGFGVAAAILMLFEGALSLRKRIPRWRAGRASTWLRAHIWLGALILPLVLYHSNFRFGGVLEQLLMLVFLSVYASGVVGLIVQQVLPWWMSIELPNESIIEQIPIVRQRLLREADSIVVAACGAVTIDSVDSERLDGRHHIVELYERHVRPLLASKPRRRDGRPSTLKRFLSRRFAATRPLVSEDLLPSLEEVYRVVLHECDLRGQLRMFFWLHSWLTLHMALSWALLVFMLAHIMSTLYY